MKINHRPGPLLLSSWRRSLTWWYTVLTTSRLNGTHVSLANHFRVTHESSCEYACASVISQRETALPTLTTSTRVCKLTMLPVWRYFFWGLRNVHALFFQMSLDVETILGQDTNSSSTVNSDSCHCTQRAQSANGYTQEKSVWTNNNIKLTQQLFTQGRACATS